MSIVSHPPPTPYLPHLLSNYMIVIISIGSSGCCCVQQLQQTCLTGPCGQLTINGKSTIMNDNKPPSPAQNFQTICTGNYTLI